jgi:hypothetical protein
MLSHRENARLSKFLAKMEIKESKIFLIFTKVLIKAKKKFKTIACICNFN